MSYVGDIRLAIEALPRYYCTSMWGCETMETSEDGDWISYSDVLALFPPARQIVYHGGERNPYGYGHAKIMPKLA